MMKPVLLISLFVLVSCTKGIHTLDPDQAFYFAEQPQITASLGSSLEYSLRVNRDGRIYYATVASGSQAPSQEDIVSGKTNGGFRPLIVAGFRMEKNATNRTRRGAVLPVANVSYDVYVVACAESGMTTMRTAVYKMTGKSTGVFSHKAIIGSLGSGDGQMNQPQGIYVEPGGGFYVIDNQNSRIEKFDSEGNFILKWGSFGTGTEQLGNMQSGLCADSSGNIYVADMGNMRIKKFNGVGRHITNSQTGYFNLLSGICTDNRGYFYTTDLILDKVCKFDANLAYVTEWGSSGSGDGQFSSPNSICSDSEGYIYVVDSGNARIQKFDSSGNFVTKWGTYGTADGQLSGPSAMCFDAAGNIYVADLANFRIQKFDHNGNFLAKWGSFGTGNDQIGQVESIGVDACGNIYVTESDNSRIHVIH